tara:strand:- start:270 stop:407 length:138 start_codon:yes stop_codon:yes gene_type:complete
MNMFDEPPYPPEFFDFIEEEEAKKEKFLLLARILSQQHAEDKNAS